MDTRDLKAEPKLRVLRSDEIPHLLAEAELGAILEWAVTDEKGIVTEHTVKKSESYVRQFLELLYIQMACLGANNAMNVRDTGNTLRAVYLSLDNNPAIRGYHLDTVAAAGSNATGIVVGLGVVAPTINDFALGSIIAHGVALNNLQYGVLTYGTPASDATTSQLTLTRNFTNGSGLGVTVTEIGLYCRAFDGVARYFMLIRDAIGGGVLVPNGQTLNRELPDPGDDLGGHKWQRSLRH